MLCGHEECCHTPAFALEVLIALSAEKNKIHDSMAPHWKERWQHLQSRTQDFKQILSLFSILNKVPLSLMCTIKRCQKKKIQVNSSNNN